MKLIVHASHSKFRLSNQEHSSLSEPRRPEGHAPQTFKTDQGMTVFSVITATKRPTNLRKKLAKRGVRKYWPPKKGYSSFKLWIL